MAVRWMTAFWDLPESTLSQGTDFWLRVTASTLSPRRGPLQEFATLIPPDGDPYLRVQALQSSGGGNHLDLHVDDKEAEFDRAIEIGATRLGAGEGHIALSSPGGFAFCIVEHGGESRAPEPVRWPAGQRGIVDQVCLDIPPERFDRELDFWESLTAWPRLTASRTEFARIDQPTEIPLSLLLQRLGKSERGGTVRAHIDLACSEVDTETERHASLGAEPLERFADWQVLRDPAGLEYCITARDPDTHRSPNRA